MPEHSETTRTQLMSESTVRYMAELSLAIGRLITAVSVDDHLAQHGTWIVTTITSQGYREVWLVPATKDATP